MKRTQILDIIRLQINQFYGAAPFVNQAEYDALSRQLLETLEQNGMVPPAVKEPCPTHYIDAMGQVKQGEDSYAFVHRWEDET